jgi:hypothetical protein
MSPVVIILPLVILAAGVAAFFLVPLELPVRVAILASDVVAAAVVGVTLWRRNRG